MTNIDNIHQGHLTRLVNWVQAMMPIPMKKKGPKGHNPHIKRQQRQAKSNHLKNKATKPDKDMPDALLGDPIVNTKKNTKMAKATGEQIA